MKLNLLLLLNIFLFAGSGLSSQELYKSPASTTETRWISPENPTGAKGAAAPTNKGAKGAAFVNVLAGEKLVMMDIKGAGIVNRMWISGTIPRSKEQCRMIKIEMYWDGETKPAVSAPIGDFFGVGLGLTVPFDDALFSNPEGRSFNFTIPMPYRKGAKMVMVNEASTHALVWFDINYTAMDKLPDDAMYFHAYWNRTTATELGKDYLILPQVKGKGRFLGTNVGVIGDSAYRNTWFGEGEIKVYLDGDDKLPTLAGTGTEDYIGSGWGQGEYHNRYQGSLVSDNKNDIYAFYRYHIPDPIYFHRDCKVSLQQIGNASAERIKEMIDKKVKIIPTWYFLGGDSTDLFNLKGKDPEQILLLDRPGYPANGSKDFPKRIFGGNFYRSDDVSATAYFYLDKPVSNLPSLGDKELRIKDMQEKVWGKANRKY